MTPARFREIGALLYGPSWKAALAVALNHGERTVRRWAGGAPTPDHVDKDLARLCREQSTKLLNVADKLDG